MADAQASVSAANAVGADQHPRAALHLKMARDQLKQAQGMVENGQEDEARLVLERSQADAELALMITRQEIASRNTLKAEADVKDIGTKN